MTQEKRQEVSQQRIISFGDSKNRCIAILTGNDWLSVALNYRCREDEKDRIWWEDNLPSDVVIEDASRDEIELLVSALIKHIRATAFRSWTDIVSASELNAERYIDRAKGISKSAFIDGARWALDWMLDKPKEE